MKSSGRGSGSARGQCEKAGEDPASRLVVPALGDELLIELEGIEKTFRVGETEIRALDGVDLDVRAGSTSPSRAPRAAESRR